VSRGTKMAFAFLPCVIVIGVPWATSSKNLDGFFLKSLIWTTLSMIPVSSVAIPSFLVSRASEGSGRVRAALERAGTPIGAYDVFITGQASVTL